MQMAKGIQGNKDWEFIAWLANRLAGLLLVLLLALHLGYMHFFATWPIRFEDVIHSSFLRTVDLSLLAVVIYHTFYGFRAWLLDFRVPEHRRPQVTWTLGLAGIALFVFGVSVFLAFLP